MNDCHRFIIAPKFATWLEVSVSAHQASNLGSLKQFPTYRLATLTSTGKLITAQDVIPRAVATIRMRLYRAGIAMIAELEDG